MGNEVEINSMAGIAYHMKRLELEILELQKNIDKVSQLENDIQLLFNHFNLEKIKMPERIILIRKKK